MGLDTRYLVITLVSVFVALSIGILIGIGITNQPSLVKLSDRVKKDFDEVRKENEAVRAERDDIENEYLASQKLIKSIFPDLLRGKLEGQRIGVVLAGGLNDTTFLEDVKHAIEFSGGEVESVTRFTDGFPSMTAGQLIELQKVLGLEDLGTEVLPRNVAGKLIAKLATSNADSIIRAVGKSKLVEFQGSYSPPFQKVVMIGGYSAKVETEGDSSEHQPRPETVHYESVDLPVIESLKALGLPIVGVEPGKVDVSFMDLYQKQQISTVDNIETYVGQVSLVYALAGEAGNYGTKSSADRLLPTLELSPAK